MQYLLRFYRHLGRSGRAAFLLTAAVYVILFQRRVLLDITAQVQTLVKVCREEVAMPPTGLFYGLTWIMGFGQANFTMLMGAAVVVLSGLALAKFWVTRHVFESYFGELDGRAGYFGWLSVALAFVCSLPTFDWWERGWYIIGQPSPNYWMNGTILASWPFAVILFWQSYRQLQRPEAGWWPWCLLWLAMLIVSKPSYAFVFALVYPPFLIGRHGFTRRILVQLLPLVLLAGLLALEYYLVFLRADSIYVKEFNSGQSSGVGWQLGKVWSLYSGNIALSILAGVTFPIATGFVYWSSLRQKLLFWYAWAGFAAALIISLLFVQTGEEYYTWAFRFQHYIAAYLLFMVSALFVWAEIRIAKYRLNKKTQALALLFALHLLSGIVYLGKMWCTKSHL